MFGFFKKASTSFAGNYAVAKVEDFGKDLQVYIAGLDPKGVSQAAIRQLDQKLDEYALATAKARQSFNKEANDVKQIDKLFNQRMSALEILAADPAKERARDLMMKQLEDMGPEVTREKEEMEHAGEMMEMWETRTKGAADALKSLKKQVKELERGIEMADSKTQMAKEKREMVNMNNGGDMGLSSALTAMKSALDDKNAEAEAEKMKSDLLTPTSIEEDPVIKAAMAEASGNTTTTLTFEERMKKLKG